MNSVAIMDGELNLISSEKLLKQKQMKFVFWLTLKLTGNDCLTG